jgi:hypothetical protein
MDDPLSSLGLTTITFSQANSNPIQVLIKRPYKNTISYPHISYASYQRLIRLSSSGYEELISVPSNGQEAYFLFYWKKRQPLALPPHPTISSSNDRLGT